MNEVTITLSTGELIALKSLVREKVEELKTVLSDKHFPGNPKESGEYREYMELKQILTKLK